MTPDSYRISIRKSAACIFPSPCCHLERKPNRCVTCNLCPCFNAHNLFALHSLKPQGETGVWASASARL